MQEEQDKLKGGTSGRNNNYSAVLEGESKKNQQEDGGLFKILKFGTNVDLSDEKKWKVQLEVKKTRKVKRGFC